MHNLELGGWGLLAEHLGPMRLLWLERPAVRRSFLGGFAALRSRLPALQELQLHRSICGDIFCFLAGYTNPSAVVVLVELGGMTRADGAAGAGTLDTFARLAGISVKLPAVQNVMSVLSVHAVNGMKAQRRRRAAPPAPPLPASSPHPSCAPATPPLPDRGAAP